MEIKGLNKLTLLDFPGKMACVVFLPRCNFRCPFCHNKSLVLSPDTQPEISEEEFFAFLEKRRGILEGVCITGGEPTLYKDLERFIDDIKKLGYLVKLDTNGYNPEVLKKVLPKLDYVAMDIKNSPEKYPETVGVTKFDVDKIFESVRILRESDIDFEFRMTVAPELQELDDFEKVGEWLAGSEKFYLQGYKDSGDVINPIFSTPSDEFLSRCANILKKYLKKVEIRG